MRKNSLIPVLSENTSVYTVKIDDKVSVVFDTGRELTVTIRTPRETNPGIGIVSYESPLGKSLLNKREGDAFEYTVGERIFKGKVIKIHK